MLMSWLTSSVHLQKFKIQIALYYTVIPENVVSDLLLQYFKAFEINW